MKIDRLFQLENYIISNGRASMEGLCENFGVSMNTLRRDIKQLVDKGVVSKVYGGVVATVSTGILPTPIRSDINVEQKELIGKLASDIVEDRDVIFIDSGTTALRIIPYLSSKKRLIIFSHSLDVLMSVSKLTNVSLYSFGGEFNSKTNSFNGLSAIRGFDDIKFSKAFIASTFISIEDGLTNNTYLEAELKKVAIKHSKSIILMADHSKLRKTAMVRFCPLENVNMFVTDKRPYAEYMEFFKNNDIDVVYDEKSL